MVKLNLDQWLAVKDFNDGELQLTFLDEGRIVPKSETGFKQDGFEITVSLPNGDNRLWTMNKTSQRVASTLYTDDTQTWVGRAIKASVVNVPFKGELVKSIMASTK